MQLVKNTISKLYHSFLNMNINPRTDLVDIQDIGMVARYNKPCNPFDGWGFMIVDAVNSNHKKLDAFKVTEEGFTFYEERLFSDIQQYFLERTGLVVPRTVIEEIERNASGHVDYYTQMANSCLLYEKANMRKKAA